MHETREGHSTGQRERQKKVVEGERRDAKERKGMGGWGVEAARGSIK